MRAALVRCIDEIADFIRGSSTNQNADPPEAARIVVAADKLAQGKNLRRRRDAMLRLEGFRRVSHGEGVLDVVVGPQPFEGGTNRVGPFCRPQLENLFGLVSAASGPRRGVARHVAKS